MVGDLGMTDFKNPVQQVIRVLNGNNPGQIMVAGGLDKLHHAPGSFIGQADGSNLSLFNQLLEYCQSVMDWRRIRVLLVKVSEFTKIVCRPVWPVQLIKIDIIGLQSLQAALDGIDEVLFIEA